MIFRNIVDKAGIFCGVYKLTFKGQYTWEYVSGTQGCGISNTYFIIYKERDSFAFSFEEGDLGEDLSPNN